MKTSIVFIVLVALNSGILSSQFSVDIGEISPLILGASVLLFVGGYFTHRIAKDVRNVFDVNIKI